MRVGLSFTLQAFLHISVYLLFLYMSFVLITEPGNRSEMEGAIQESVNDQIAPYVDYEAVAGIQDKLKAELASIPTKPLNNRIWGISNGLVSLMFLIGAMIIAGVVKEWDTFGFGLVENIFFVLVALTVWSTLYLTSYQHYHNVLPSSITNAIVPSIDS